MRQLTIMITDKNGKQIIPPFALPPGEFIANELKARGMTQRELSELTEINLSVLNEIIKGKKSISAENATLFEKVLNISSELLLRAQNIYELDLAAIQNNLQQKQRNIEIWEAAKPHFPEKIFRKSGWLFDSISKNIERIWDIFNVKSIEEFLNLVADDKNRFAYYRKSDKCKVDPVNLFGWKHIAMWKSSKIDIANEFNPEKESFVISELNKIFIKNINLLKETELVLNTSGIKFFVLHNFPETPIDGFSFWEGKNPTIVLTVRHNRLDNYAFALMHEVGHIFHDVKKDSGQFFINIENGSDCDKIEQKAEKFSANMLIPPEIESDFVKKANNCPISIIPKFVKEYAENKSIAPAILMGRWQFRTQCFSIGKTLITKVI